MRRFPLILALLVSTCCVLAAPAGASFGLEKFDVTYTNQDGSPDTQAGSHPFQMTTSVYLNQAGPREPDGEFKDGVFRQIAGLIGDPQAAPRCSTVDFLTVSPKGDSTSHCPDSTAVGYANSETDIIGGVSPVFNLVPPPGVSEKLGFIVYTTPITIEVGLEDHFPYNVTAVVHNLPQTVAIDSSVLTLWGDPEDPAHDPYRGKCVSSFGGGPIVTPEKYPYPASHGECHTNAPDVPLLTLPRACEGPLSSTYAVDSWQHPGAFLLDGEPDLSGPNWVTGEAVTHDDSSPANPAGMTGCAKLGFGPSITSQPTSVAAQSPTGLDFDLNVQDAGLTSPTGLAQSDIKKTVVTLPEGMTANPSLAEGLGVCTEEDLARETVSSVAGAGCPEASKIGTVEVETPLLSEQLKGSLYIAKPFANPFNSLLAIYFVIKNPTLGIIVKQPAEIVPDRTTGRITTIVENIPQLPFSHFKLHFREGARSPLVSPPGCGTYDAKAELTPWSGGPTITTTSAFQILVGPNDGPCPPGGVPPFAPAASSGTQNNNAGAYSPFYLRIERKDGEQELTKFTTTLPPGLTGNLSGIPFCADSSIEAARNVTGAQETANPSCPAASEIGHTLVGAGVGGVLAYTPGKVYLAGPYHGSALSVVSITSATVGPFDLGTVVIRFALRINPITAQVEIDSTGSDPIPHIIDGIVVHVREIHVYVDREKFILNPTSCNSLSISNTITGAGADFTNPADANPVTVSSRFQASDCSSLGFKPSFKVSTAGKTSRANGASLSVKLVYPKAPQGSQANIKLGQGRPAQATALPAYDAAEGVHEQPVRSEPRGMPVGVDRWTRYGDHADPACPTDGTSVFRLLRRCQVPRTRRGPPRLRRHDRPARRNVHQQSGGHQQHVPRSPRPTRHELPAHPAPRQVLCTGGQRQPLHSETHDADHVHCTERRRNQTEHADRCDRLSKAQAQKIKEDEKGGRSETCA